jgi:hypothetical protein
MTAMETFDASHNTLTGANGGCKYDSNLLEMDCWRATELHCAATGNVVYKGAATNNLAVHLLVALACRF